MPNKWTNPSVGLLAQGADPVEVVQSKVVSLIRDAMQKGWRGPPFDPIELASLLNCRVVPSDEVDDARLIPDGRGYRIEFNPSQPHRRVRFSIAHELGHTLFPDCRNQVRNRMKRGAMRDDDWQLEMLCNIAAAEILMPGKEIPISKSARLSISDILQFQDEFDVSTEAILQRVVKLERRNCFIFVASPRASGITIDYVVESYGAGFDVEAGTSLPPNSCVSDCVAIGYTSSGDEVWKTQKLRVECVAIPGYPGSTSPRIAGLAYRIGERGEGRPRLNIQIGDATKPRGSGTKIISHVVNDKAKLWGGRGFAFAIRKLWPAVKDDFVDWATMYPRNFRLGHSHIARVNSDVSVFSMIAQHGYGPSTRPRIRYDVLARCLDELRETALAENATVHMPRIGCGEAGGSWSIVEDIIRESLLDHGIEVTVYDLKGKPRKPESKTQQMSLFAS